MENKQLLRRKRILSGNLWTTVLIIIAPLALYQLFNSFYSLIDAAICAQISTSAQTKVVAINQIKSTISAFGAGLAAGGAVIVSRRYGAGDLTEAKHNASNMLFMSLVLLIPTSEIPTAGIPESGIPTVGNPRCWIFAPWKNSVFAGLSAFSSSDLLEILISQGPLSGSSKRSYSRHVPLPVECTYIFK